jgi:hypothetical protein
MVVISYAAADAPRVWPVRDALKQAGVEVFDYVERQDSSVGRPLREVLTRTFGARHTTCVAFASASYRQRPWTSFELGALLAQQRRGRRPLLFPVSLDGTMFATLEDVVHWRLDRDSSVTDLVKAVAHADTMGRRRRAWARGLAAAAAALVAVFAGSALYDTNDPAPAMTPEPPPSVAGAHPIPLDTSKAPDNTLHPFVHTRVIDRGRVVCDGITDRLGRLRCDLPPGRYTVVADVPGLLNPRDVDLAFER